MKTNEFLSSAFRIVEDLNGQRGESTCENYLTALKSLCSYVSQRQTGNTPFDRPLLAAYQYWLQKERSLCLNTVSCYMRSLRTIFRLMSGSIEVFDVVFTGFTRTKKRSLTVEDVRTLQKLDLKAHPKMEMARDIFLFSIYALGMPFVDVAFLKKQSLRHDSFTYRRHKTGQPVCVPMQPCMESIISKYLQRDGSEYVFPILTHSEHNKAYRQYHYQLCNYNRQLKKLARYAQMDVVLSSYVVRHTWASLAFNQNIELNVISKALGHTNTNTTLVYVRELNDDRLIKASNIVVDAILKP